MQLAYREYGAGKNLLILLHGLMGMSDNWAGYARKFSSDHHLRIVLPDLRNHGNSPHSENFALTDITQDMISFIPEKSEGKTIIAGHSLGGLVAMELFMLKNKAFDALVVIDIAPKTQTLSDVSISITQKALQVQLNKLATLGEIESALKESGIRQPYVSLLLKNIRRNTDGSFAWKCNLNAIASIKEIVFTVQSSVQYEESPKPVLFIRGSHSDYLKTNDYTYIEKFFPDATVAVIENAGHWPHADQPEIFYSIMSEFISGVLSC